MKIDKNFINGLIGLASHLDKNGYSKQANYVDRIIKIADETMTQGEYLEFKKKMREQERGEELLAEMKKLKERMETIKVEIKHLNKEMNTLDRISHEGEETQEFMDVALEPSLIEHQMKEVAQEIVDIAQEFYSTEDTLRAVDDKYLGYNTKAHDPHPDRNYDPSEYEPAYGWSVEKEPGLEWGAPKRLEIAEASDISKKLKKLSSHLKNSKNYSHYRALNRVTKSIKSEE